MADRLIIIPTIYYTYYYHLHRNSNINHNLCYLERPSWLLQTSRHTVDKDQNDIQAVAGNDNNED